MEYCDAEIVCEINCYPFITVKSFKSLKNELQLDGVFKGSLISVTSDNQLLTHVYVAKPDNLIENRGLFYCDPWTHEIGIAGTEIYTLSNIISYYDSYTKYPPKVIHIYDRFIVNTKIKDSFKPFKLAILNTYENSYGEGEMFIDAGYILHETSECHNRYIYYINQCHVAHICIPLDVSINCKHKIIHKNTEMEIRKVKHNLSNKLTYLTCKYVDNKLTNKLKKKKIVCMKR